MLTRLRLENFKSWQDTGNITLRPITGFFGANSSGKSGLIHALLLLKQTADAADRGIVFNFGGPGRGWTRGTLQALCIGMWKTAFLAFHSTGEPRSPSK